jgi:hypothetical protein
VRRLGLVLFVLIGFALLMGGNAVVGDSESYSLLVPLYIYPGCEWDSITHIKSTYPSASITVIANPDNGPGASKDETYATYIAEMQESGVKVLGYVPTGYGSRDISEVESEVDRWVEWYNIDGIFFDEVSTDSDKEAYYQSLVDYLKNKSSSYMAVGNPGTYDPDTLSNYTAIFDVLIVYEDPGYPASLPSGNPDKLGVLVYDAPTFEEGKFSNILGKAHYVYVTDDSGDNPWDTLSNYFVDEVAVIAGSEVTDYVMNLSSLTTTNHTVVSRYLGYDPSNGPLWLNISVVFNAAQPGNDGIWLPYVTVNESGNAVDVGFHYWSADRNTSLYADYDWDGGVDVWDYVQDIDKKWHNLSIRIGPDSIRWYVDGTLVREKTGLDISEVMEIGAGSFDNSAVYRLYLDNVSGCLPAVSYTHLTLPTIA